MLATDARTVAIDLLRPPPGRRLDFALLTTYALDLEVLLALPLGVLAHADGGVEELLCDPLLLLQAIREAGDRVHVFVDEAGIAIPRKERALYAMLESSVHPVRAPNAGAFHPKVWVARFIAEDEAPLLRVAVLSRNLTFDRSWDIALVSEASPRSGQREAASRPLGEFLRKLPDLTTERSGLDEQVAQWAQMLAREVERTRFPGPEGLDRDPIKFYSLGLSEQPLPWLALTGERRTLAIAPFVSRTALDSIIGTGRNNPMLVSRQEELDKLPAAALDKWDPDQIRVLSDAAHDESEDGADNRPCGLHAKIIAVEHGRDVMWYVGSANLTDAAFAGRNVEMMAAVTGRKGRINGRGFGIEHFLESGFRDLCTSYRRSEPKPEDADEVQALARLERARGCLVHADLRVVCSVADDVWTWALEGSFTPTDDVDIALWPISIIEEQARPLDLPMNWTLPVDRLTGFVAFRLSVPVPGVNDIRLALRLPAEGMPADRMHQVLKTLIDNPERFLRFLRALLGGLDGMVDWAQDSGEAPGNGAWGDGWSGETLLEDLVRTASRDPDRLKPVRQLIGDLRKTEEGEGIIPDDLFEIWTAVDKTLREGRGS